jgi:soluble lytic murein transglycosylase-like protein
MSILYRDLSSEDAAAAGYFRIGNLVLSTPPTDILTNRVSGKDRITVLRGSNDMVKMTGHGRWDVTVRWMAMLDDAVGNIDGKYAQWEQVRTVVAMFKSAPFVEVENSYIRQILSEQDPLFRNMRVAFALRQLRISTHADIVDALDCALTMTLFNYYPYSSDFAYAGPGGEPVDADRSPLFSAYLETWKRQNLDASKDTTYDGPLMADYRKQTPGTVKLRWREYRTLKIDTAVVTGTSPASAEALNQATASSTKSSADINVTGKYDDLIRKYAAQDGLSPAMVKAVMMHESSGVATALGANFKGRQTAAGNSTNAVTAYLKQHIQSDSDGGLSVLTTYTQQNGVGPDLGLMQTQFPTAKKYIPGVRPVDLFNPETSIRAGCAYLQHLYSTGMTDQQIYAYNTGSVKRTNATPDPDGTPYAVDVLRKRDSYAIADTASSAAAQQPSLAAAAASQSLATPTQPAAQQTSLSGASTIDQIIAKLSPDQQAEVQSMIDNGWIPDYNTNDLVYFYLTHEWTLADEEHQDASTIPAGSADIQMYPQQFSVLMVNNLAQIPLDAYMYPTYQHIGSPSSEVSITFLSKGRETGTGDPTHAGLGLMGGLVAFMESQYLAYRTSWRRVSSVHRMHAVYIENQILNMLGIRGLTLDNLASETVPDTSDLMHAELSAKQYENIFENIGPYQINTVSGVSTTVTQNIINSNALQGLSPTEQKAVPSLTAFSAGRNSANTSTLSAYLLQLAQQKTNIFSSFSSLAAASPTSQQQQDMLALVNPGITKSSTSSVMSQTISVSQLANTNDVQYPAVVSRFNAVQSSGSWTTGDAALILALATDPSIQSMTTQYSTSAGSTVGLSLGSQTTTALQTAQTDATSLLGGTANIQAVYDAIFPLLSATDITFAQEMDTLSSSSAFSSKYTSAFDAVGPASSSKNLNSGNQSPHASYRDLGLYQLTVGGADNNPGCYFVDHSKEYDAEVRKELGLVISGAQQTANQMNQSTTAKEYYMAITDTDFTGLRCDTESLVRSTNIPGMSMSEAFPTFKLFLMEDEAPSLINCFDNFYSYASVEEMEIIRYQDKPDVAVIQITNIANLLMHHLYDDSIMGRYDLSLHPYEQMMSSSSPVMGQEAAVLMGKNFAGQVYTYADLSDGGMTSSAKARIPLQYVALMPGTKIQIRLGFSNNPDKLTPVFTGRVTEINSEGDMLVITAESFLGELCSLPVYDGKPLGKQTMGREWIIPHAADSSSLVEYFLTTDTAKHFGGLKLAAATDQLVTGLTWTRALGKAVGEFSLSPTNVLSKVGAAAVASYDRTPENILINHVVDYSGAASQVNSNPGVSVRSFADASSSNWFNEFTYHIAENATFTSWDYIRDVCRRFPELVVACKQYGFPFAADATLVVAHPLDWYYARPPLIGDVETYRTSQDAVSEWGTWWSQFGQGLWTALIANIANVLGYPQFTVRTMLQPPGLTGFSTSNPTSPTDLYERMDACYQRANSLSGMDVGSNDPNALAQALYGIDVGLDNLLNQGESIINIALGGGNLVAVKDAKLKAIREAELSVWNAWMVYVDQQAAAKTGSSMPVERLKPVRRYHFIDQNSIIRNSMRVNDKIYNGIKVGKSTVMANDHIPPQYRRILDATQLVNDWEHNLTTSALEIAVAQSFLKEEVGKMYEGEIVLRGIPEIEPYDCLVLLDPSTAVTGVVEVGKVIHSFTLETGYITIVYPRAVIAINEAASAGTLRMFQMVMAKSWFTLNGLTPQGGFGQTWKSGDTIQKTATVGAAVVGTVAVGAGLIAMGTPIGWTAALLGSAVLYGGLLTGYKNETANTIQVMPVSRYARPWYGGLEGYQISDFWQNLGSQFQSWESDNIWPLIQMYRNLQASSPSTTPVQSNPTTSGAQ